jgi:hypothetical protein
VLDISEAACLNVKGEEGVRVCSGERTRGDRRWGMIRCGVFMRGMFLKLSNMGLLVSVKVSFICCFCEVRLYMWNRSNVFNRRPFFWMWILSIISSIVSCVLAV